MQTTKERSALPDSLLDGKIGTQLELPLNGLGEPRISTKMPKRTAKKSARQDELFHLYRRRTASRLAPATVKKYTWTLEQCLRLAEKQVGHPVSVTDFLMDRSLLGYVCSTVERPCGGSPISAWTAAHRRTVLRSAAGALAPELRALGLVEPIQHVNRAIQEVAEKVGGGYRLPVGKPRHRGRPAPSASELDALLTNLGADEGWAGQRNVLFFGILAATGVRVRALLEIDGRDICLMGDGTVRLFLHDKASGGRFELELPCHFRDPLDAYFAAVNLSLVGRGKGRVGFGKAGAVWRGPNGNQWSYAWIGRRLRAACQAARTPDYTPHSFRAYFATRATSIAPRRVAALAGGWRGTERMDDHYVGVPRDAIERKLARIGVSRPDRRESLPDRQAAAARILSAAPGARATAEPVRAGRLPA